MNDMMKRWFEVEAKQVNKMNALALTNESNGISVDYRHFSSTCPNPGRVINDTQIQDQLPLLEGNGSPSWECFKENTIIGALYRQHLEVFTTIQRVFRERCCITEFSV